MTPEERIQAAARAISQYSNYSGHHRLECVHGVLISQCRCYSSNKIVRVQKCDDPNHAEKKIIHDQLR